MNGNSGLTWYLPAIISVSAKLTPQARTRMRASFGPQRRARGVFEPQAVGTAPFAAENRLHPTSSLMTADKSSPKRGTKAGKMQDRMANGLAAGLCESANSGQFCLEISWMSCASKWKVIAAAAAVAAAVSPALAQQKGGVLRMYHRDSPASMSILEEATFSTVIPIMGVMNNLVMYDQNKPQNSLDDIVPDLADELELERGRQDADIQAARGRQMA